MAPPLSQSIHDSVLSVSFCGWAISTPPSTPSFILFSVLNSGETKIDNNTNGELRVKLVFLGKHLRSCYVDGETITTDQDTCNKRKSNKSEIISFTVSENCDGLI